MLSCGRGADSRLSFPSLWWSSAHLQLSPLYTSLLHLPSPLHLPSLLYTPLLTCCSAKIWLERFISYDLYPLELCFRYVLYWLSVKSLERGLLLCGGCLDPSNLRFTKYSTSQESRHCGFPIIVYCLDQNCLALRS